ncbi:ROK family transcriptional regulator [Nocardioides terrisoli]|uniref:ROK family transcriptional regulator n=1 Tax=Nocardioides terrisoli TaxID=3388267 RepID=UPI00287BC232|nr:ROK family transcriptional regulator [Nocardioides marmorisolisilvae]
MVRSAAGAARPDEIRRHNLSLVLTHIHRDGALTRAELTQRLGLSRSTVGALVSDLTRLGLVEELVPTGGAGVGRPSHVVGPRRGGPYAVGVDIEVARVTVAAVGLGGDILAREEFDTERGRLTPAALVNHVSAAMRRLRQMAHTEDRPCGIGVSVPGTVDQRTGRIGVAPNLGWREVALGDLLAASVPEVPVAVGNDADLSVYAEHQRGSARGCDDVVFLLGRIGVGAGIIAGGVPLRGRDGHAGEIGHNVLDPAGPPCHCGQRGCVETFIGDAALLARAGREDLPAEGAIASLFADARAGLMPAADVVQAAAEPLGRTLANLLNTLNPSCVVLGGSVGELLDLAGEEVRAHVDRYTFGTAHREVDLVTPGLGHDSALLGAAELAFTSLLADPR